MSSAQDRRRGVSHQSTEIDGNRRKSTRSSIGSYFYVPSTTSNARRCPQRKMEGLERYNSGDLVSSPRDDTPGHQILTRRFQICTVTGNSAVSHGALLFLCSFVPRFGCTTRQRTMPSGKPPHPPVDADVEGAKCFFPQAPSRLTLEQERNRSAVLPQHLTNLPIHASPPRFAAPIPIPLVVADPQSKNHLTDPVTGKIILSAVSEAYNRMLDTLGTVIQIAERALEG
ncbi:hypothetical protein EDD15DRAFT_2203252 [Pisolithus albus]|nr:hypothetical protein EDD15DRAFT_2203252 [Pisolithus albus]